MTSTQSYTLKDFNDISKSGYEFILPSDTVDIINVLADKVGAPSYVRTPNFKNDKRPRGGGGGGKRRKNKAMEISDEDWEAIRNFQATEIKEAEGIDKLINNIKLEINKITKTTYGNQVGVICAQLEELDASTLFTDEEKTRVGEIIFDVASSNKFYSDLYAKFVHELSRKFSWLLDVFHDSLKRRTEKFMVFEVADSNKDYEKFCKVNKDNETRKALTLFYVNLMKKNIVTQETIVEVLDTFKEQLKENLQKEDCSSIVEQLAENICIIIEKIFEDFEDDDDFDNVISYMRTVSNSKVSEYPGLSNKTIFRFMDALDIIS